MDDLLTLKQVQQQYGINRHTVYAERSKTNGSREHPINRNFPDAALRIGNVLYWRRSDIEAWLQEQKEDYARERALRKERQRADPRCRTTI